MTLMTNRPALGPRYFGSWRAYLESWDGGGRTDVSFCRAITDIYQPFVSPEWANLDAREKGVDALRQSGGNEEDIEQAYAQLDGQRADVGLHFGFPWVTPVLGSGCLSAEECAEGGAAIHSVPAEVAGAASGWGELWDGTTKAEVVERFARALARGKVGEAPKDRDQPVQSKRTKALEAKRALTARVLLCAHLLSRLYFAVGALTQSPVGVSSGVLTFDRRQEASADRGAELWDALVTPLRAELENLRRDITDSGREDLAFVSTFAEAVGEDLTRSEPQVTRSDAELMAEISWHLMTEDTSQYPGWADLLVLLTLANQTTDRDQRWPHLTNLEVARQKLQVELDRTTTLSWASRLPLSDSMGVDRHGSVRDRLYEAVADLLIAQAALHADRPGDGHERPPAVAYVTSFDLELEMALVARRSAFRLVMPFYVRGLGDPNPSGFVWLQTTITPPTADEPLTAKHLRDLRTTRGWTLVTSVPHGAEDDFTLPIVVRVAGCPLIRVEGFTDLGGRASVAKAPWITALEDALNRNNVRLAGTVLLDEHTALHQWAADLGSITNKNHEVVRLGLPERLVKGGGSFDARFWFLLGVQLNDEAVRHRTAAIVGAADLRGGDVKAERSSVRAGVVVNRRSTPNERDVFLWQRMDVVQATYEDVLSDLEHAAAHVASPRDRRVQGEPCPFPSSPDETELP